MHYERSLSGPRALSSWASVALGLSRHWGAGRRDLVADLPQVFVEPVLHALLQHFHRRPHGADDAAADDALGELEVVEAEQLHALVEIDQPLGDIVQTEEFFVAAIKVVRGDAGGVELVMKRVAKSRANMEQRQKSRRVEPAAVTESRADDVIVVGRDRLKNMEQPDGRLDQLVGAPDQARRVPVVAALEIFELERALEYLERGDYGN